MAHSDKSSEENYSVPLRKIPKASWYSKFKSPYQSKRELKNYIKGGLVLVGFIGLFFLSLYWLVATFVN